MSTACVAPAETERCFRLALLAGFDGIEVVMTRAACTRDPQHLLALSMKYELPILSVRAPRRHIPWGLRPRRALEDAAALAHAVGAGTVVAAPPYRWQRRHTREFALVVRETARYYGVELAIAQVRARVWAGLPLRLHAHRDRVGADGHASLAVPRHHRGGQPVAVAQHLGSRLRHLRISDSPCVRGRGPAEHNPTIGAPATLSPATALLRGLARRRWRGPVIVHFSTRRARNEPDRLRLLRDTLAFARDGLGLTTV